MSVFALTATGVGSWPGVDPLVPAAVVLGELGGAGGLPYLPELPARGAGADMIGRTAAMLVDLPVDVSPSGYRLSTRPGALWRRARELMQRDIDAFEEHWERGNHRAHVRAVKIQITGPVTLAASLELVNGHPALDDKGATRDVAESLAEGVTRAVAELTRRLGVPIVVQIDEPRLSAALHGEIRGVSVLQPARTPPAAEAEGLLSVVAGACASAMVHVCSHSIPWSLLSALPVSAVNVPLADAGRAVDREFIEGCAEFLDSGRTVVFGVVPVGGERAGTSAAQLAERVLALGSAAGFAPAGLVQRAGISPECGLAGVSVRAAQHVTRLTREVAEQLQEAR
ncbi:methionine synthase [Hoyosella sp. YIM 151337]|uniref:methionine synthase n=1 Tax=Hoyosella sp. YIM 151337 TaxID=2992742 RepID=UPI002235C8D8|nr:methionine synthase [Hoyosella sp. YIM 151337]MCW4354585.1 methionine synthase [Hoyosella sp. YIM 151337]